MTMGSLPSRRSRGLVSWAALASLVLFSIVASSASAHAQAQPEGTGRLASIEVTGSRFSSGQIAAASGLHVGESVTREDFQAAANRLSALGLFASVRYRFSSQADRVKLEFQVQDAATAPVSFDNFPWFTDEELTQALKNSVTLFDGRAPTEGSIVDTMADTLTKLLETRGVHAAVDHELVRLPDSDDSIQRFSVAGASLKVGAIEFTDPLARDDPHIQDRLSDVVGKPYSRYAMAVFNLEQVRPVYFQHAHLRVRFDVPKARFSGDPNRPLPDTVVVIDPIEPGPTYTWDSITWSGNTAFSSDELAQLVGLHRGEPADGMKTQAAWDRVAAAYGKRGYLEAKVNAAENFDDAKARAGYRVSITEGTQYHMGDLVITGLSLEGERRARAGWKIDKGQVFDRAYFDEYLEKGVREALGDLPAHYDKIGHLLETHPEAATVNVLLDFQ
jgi:outer membrane protein assembly factor BamA